VPIEKFYQFENLFLCKTHSIEGKDDKKRKTIHFVSKLISIPTKNITEEFLGHSQPFHSV
jgi:hypothetical protein